LAEGDRNTIDLVPGFLCLCSPSLEQFQQSVLVGRELLQRLAFQARYHPGNEPTLFAELDHGD
jgi:hypothetical protein